MRQKIGIMVAVDKNWRIGGESDFPLGTLETNMRWLGAIAIETTIIFGRRTYESVSAFNPLIFGRPFIVLSRSNSLEVKGSVVCHSALKALDTAHRLNKSKEIVAVGGEEIFKEFFPLASHLYIAQSNRRVKGAMKISSLITMDRWYSGKRECHNLGGNETQQSFSFITFEKRKTHPVAV